MSVSSTDKGLSTPENSAVIFIDYQPQMSFAVADIDRQDQRNNALFLARAAKIFGVPVILTAVEAVTPLNEQCCVNSPQRASEPA